MTRKRRDDSPDNRAVDPIDEALEETFPGSDAPANTVVTGVGVPRHERKENIPPPAVTSTRAP